MRVTPNTAVWRSQALSFDTVAEAYERFRPAYPAELIERIQTCSALPDTAHLLEVGCGTGKATRLFAQKGFHILALDPGAQLIAQAQKNLAAFNRLSFKTTRFEDWTPERQRFDLVFSAQAFHWVEKPKGFALAAEALKPNGWLALFWNTPEETREPIFAEFETFYQRFAPTLASAPQWKALARHSPHEIQDSGYFTAPEIIEFKWEQRYTTKEYIGLIGTHSDHIALPADQREALFTAIASTIDAHGGSFNKPYNTILYLARKAD